MPVPATKSVQKCVALRTPEKGPHARTFRTHLRLPFARTRTRATAHRTCACAHAPSQLTPWKIRKEFLQMEKTDLKGTGIIF